MQRQPKQIHKMINLFNISGRLMEGIDDQVKQIWKVIKGFIFYLKNINYLIYFLNKGKFLEL